MSPQGPQRAVWAALTDARAIRQSWGRVLEAEELGPERAGHIAAHGFARPLSSPPKAVRVGVAASAGGARADRKDRSSEAGPAASSGAGARAGKRT